MVRDFLANLRQPGMPPRVWVSKFLRNRYRTIAVKPRGCCGNAGEPGC